MMISMTGTMNDKDESKYWFTRNKINTITKVHDYLDSLEGVGKVISRLLL